jgi:prepilin-type N-terminal cleavage/methylation domain-containing protein/prepilin-type processing-associated H-X9-DG protein
MNRSLQLLRSGREGADCFCPSTRRGNDEPSSFSSATPHRAFTLIELLVVIAIIAVLASLLLPALARAKMVAQRTACMSNFKQWGLAMLMYADDHDDFIPRESFSLGSQMNRFDQIRDPVSADVWYNALPPYLSATRASNYFFMRPAFYERNSLFQCPSARFPKNLLYAYFSMAWNSKVIKLGLPINLNDFCRRPDTVMFLDSRLDGEPMPGPGMEAASLGQPAAYANRFSIRHGGRGNLIFWDGHAGSFPGGEVVDLQPGQGNYGLAIRPQTRIVWDLCPPP